MYKSIIRPLLFKLQPETIHHIVVKMLKIGFAIPGMKCLIHSIFTVNDSRLEKEVCGIKFKNPVGIAAGFDKEAAFYNELSNLGFGYIEVGTVTPEGQAGNPKPRSFRIKKDKGLINRMGFNNRGLNFAVENLKKRKTHAVIGGNIGKNTNTPNENALQDYEKCFNGLYDYVDYFVVNVSCPNITNLRELQDQDKLMSILSRLKELRSQKEKHKPIFLKVSPDLNQGQLDEVIQIIDSTKIDGVVATNTTVSRSNLNTDIQTIEAIGNGGMSGKPIKDRATEVIRYLSEKSNKSFAIIGVGGIFTPEDAIEKLEAGADIIQVYTGFIYEGPMIAKKINKRILKEIKSGNKKLL
ncbi:MAG: quinone-dependent dihydroorotate dehydrogenase [Hyphomicrobiales bacterium]